MQLGICFFEGKAVEQNFERAFELFSKAADHGCANAQYYLGNCYYTGKGTKINRELAIEMWEKSADNYNVEAQYRLGYYYDEIGKKDIAQHWYKLASANEHVKAQNNLGILYAENGDAIKAKELFSRARKRSDNARDNFEALLHQMPYRKESPDQFDNNAFKNIKTELSTTIKVKSGDNERKPSYIILK